MIDDNLEEKYHEFLNRFENEPEMIKKQVNFKSIQNITNQILKIYNKEETEKYKMLLIEYFQKVEKENFPTGKIFRIEINKNYLVKIGGYLTKKKDFRSGINLYLQLLFGIMIDVIVYNLTMDLLKIYFPIFSVILFLNGIHTRRTAKKENRYYNRGY